MWMFTRYGFYSVVCARQEGGGYHAPVDPHRLQVRVRVLDHLYALCERFPQLQTFPIVSDVGTDYRHRIYVPKAVWTSVAEEMARELDYDNFKSEAAAFQANRPDRDEANAYIDLLHKVWSDGSRLQKQSS